MMRKWIIPGRYVTGREMAEAGMDVELARSTAGGDSARRFADDLTQTEISDRIGVSQMQVSRIIRQSIAKLRLEIDRTPAA